MIHVMSRKLPSLNEKTKFPSRTSAKLLEEFQVRLMQIRRLPAFDDLERVLPGEAMLSAIVIDFLDKPHDEQVRILEACVPRFFAMRADDAQAEGPEARDAATVDPIDSASDAEPGPLPVPKPGGRRRKSG